MNSGAVIGLAWYTEPDWERLRELASDPDDIDQSFSDWHASAVILECELASQGKDVRRVMIDPAALSAWCKARGRPLDRAARAAYAAKQLEAAASAGDR